MRSGTRHDLEAQQRSCFELVLCCVPFYLKRSGASFTYCGRQLTITPTEIRVCMAAACRDCEEIPIRPERRRQRESAVTPSEKSSFRKLLGNAQWCTGQLRLDCACEVNRLAQKVEKATVEDLILLNKAAERLRTSAERSLLEAAVIYYTEWGCSDLKNCGAPNKINNLKT